MKIPVTTFYLEMLSPSELRPSARPHPKFELRQILPPLPRLNRELYIAVGRDWHWMDRLVWSAEKWESYVNRSELETWVATVGGETAGYFELESQPEGNVEIAYFGLTPSFIGKGLGGALLTATLRRAWATGSRRVWVHTCTRDHSSALANYQARGMRLYKETVHEEEK